MNRLKDKIMIIGFFAILVVFPIIGIFLSDQEVSSSERRNLSMFPNIVENGKVNFEFFDEFNEYVVDQFPGRDFFRMIKAVSQFSIFGHLENDGVFVKDGMIYETSHLNRKSIMTFIEKLNQIQVKYLDDSNSIYYSVIPSKIHYLEDDRYPRINYDDLISSLKESLSNDFQFIDIQDTLNKESYYATDIHWRQETLDEVVSKLLHGMNTEIVSISYEEHSFSNFAGSMYSKIALPVAKENLVYRTNSFLDSILVYNYEKNERMPVYQEEYYSHVDPYDVFLGGATPLLVIDNPELEKGKNLIIFRDSFASSLTPLLISSYDKITLIDLRYIGTDYLESIIDFKDSDILFLYSDEVINNSFLLK